MHMSDALVSPSVAAVMGAVSIAALSVAVRKVKRFAADDRTPDRGSALIPTMGVLGAFVFAAQMINFSIPGTGSSGHIVGGILLSALLGPWAALIVLGSVLAVQCLLFADGGFLAFGCNLFNMAVLSCWVAYPLLFRPFVRRDVSPGRLFAASLVASVAALELGALAVTLETEWSGVTALPVGRFLLFMLPIHLLIGVGEGLATAAVIGALRYYRPGMLADLPATGRRPRRSAAAVLGFFVLAALLIGGSFSWVASADPDGLEWSIEKVAGNAGAALEAQPSGACHRWSASAQRTTALMPDYDTSAAGLVGCGVILAVVGGVSYLFRAKSGGR